MNDLGGFAEGFASWAKVLARTIGVDPAARQEIFRNLASDVAGYVRNGLPKALAAEGLWELAQAHGLVAAFGADAIQGDIAEAFKDIEQDQGGPRRPNGKNGHALALPATSPFPIDGAKLPRRAWLVPGLLLRGQVTLLVAPPGSGKSLLTLQLAMVCDSGMREWGGWQPRGRYRSLVINVEEDETEMRRRLFGAHKIMNLRQEDLAGIFLAEAGSIVVARADSRTKTVTATPVLDRIVQTIIELKIDIVIVDPFAETFAGDENSNSELKWAGVLWREVARKTNVAVLLVHHAKKYASNMAGDMDASRGGGALSGVARIVSTLFPMTELEFEHYRADIKKAFPKAADRSRFIRFDDAKANLSLLTPAARWFFKETIGLGNGGDGLPEDEVGVLVPWPAPGVFSNLDRERLACVLDEIAVGVRDGDGEPTGDPYGPSKKGGTKRWVGGLIQEQLQLNEKQAREIIAVWLDTGLLIEFKAKTSTSKGNVRDCLRVDNAKRPGTVTENIIL